MLRSSISSSPLKSFISISSMSSSSSSGRGRGQWHRGLCGRPFVSGDSHLNAVRDANYGHRQGYQGNYSNPRVGTGNYSNFRPRLPPQFRPNPRPQFRPQQRPDDHRNWAYAVSQPPPQCERFSILSYNILADYLARDHRSKLYFHIPHYILDWEWRKKRLFLEFGLWSPDILCLQEVDRFHDLEEELAIRGYAGIWKMRTGNAIDGCAIFWRTNRFQLRHEEHIEFNKVGLRDNVAQICVLESRNQNPAENLPMSSVASSDKSRFNRVVVCNIHVLFNPKRGEMKLGQVRLLLDRAYAISRIWDDAPVVVCGDFNSTPKSPMYKFISERKLDFSELARDQISGQYAPSLYAPRPYVGSAYRPQWSMDNCTELKDFQRDSKFMGIGNNEKYHSDTENLSRMETVPSPHLLTVMPSGKLFSDSQKIVDRITDNVSKERDVMQMLDGCSGDDTSSSSAIFDTSQRKDVACQLLGEKNQDITACASFSDPGFGELQLEQGGNSSTIQTCHSILHSLNGFHSQSSERVADQDSAADRELHQELNDLLHRQTDMSESNSLTPVDNLTDNMIMNQASPNESQHMNIEKAMLPKSISVKEPQSNFPSISSTDMASGISSSNSEAFLLENMESLPELANKVKVGINIQCSSSPSAVDSISKENHGNIGSDMVLSCTEENETLGMTDSNTIGAKSEEPKQVSSKANSSGRSHLEHLDGHSDIGQAGSVINELCSSGENLDTNFLQELVGEEDARDCTEFYGENNFPVSPDYKEGNAENRKDTTSSTCFHKSHLDLPTVKNQDDSSGPVSRLAPNTEHCYNPYVWTPMEIEVASGKQGCSFVEHRLKLRSAYVDVEDYAGTKDSSREPEVTSYHRQFMGTVDYIWYSEGLQTIKVLDTIPKHVLQRTAGFPTRKWGSDHLALACELAFTNGAETTK